MLSSSRSVPTTQVEQYRAMLASETRFPCNRMMNQETPWASLRRIFNNQEAVPSLACGTANPSKTEESLMCKDCYSELKHQQDKSVEEIPLRGSVADLEAQAELDRPNNRNALQRFYDNHPTASKVIMALALGGAVVATIGTVAAMTVPKAGDNQPPQNNNETCLAEYGQLFYADNNNCVARPAISSDCHPQTQYYSNGECKLVDDAFCTKQAQVFSNGQCRTKTPEEAECTDSQVYVESDGSCRAKQETDCDAKKQVFEYGNCRPLDETDCTQKRLIFDEQEEICRNFRAEDCAEYDAVLGNDGQCRIKTPEEAKCDSNQVYVKENGSCRSKIASDCDKEKQVFDEGNCRSLQFSDCAEKQKTLDIEQGICRDITEEDCANDNKILDNKQCRTRTQQDCQKTGQRLDAANTCQDWTIKECKKTPNKKFNGITKQCEEVTAKDCLPQVQWFDSEKRDCTNYTEETCKAEGKNFDSRDNICLDFAQGNATPPPSTISPPPSTISPPPSTISPPSSTEVTQKPNTTTKRRITARPAPPKFKAKVDITARNKLAVHNASFQVKVTDRQGTQLHDSGNACHGITAWFTCTVTKELTDIESNRFPLKVTIDEWRDSYKYSNPPSYYLYQGQTIDKCIHFYRVGSKKTVAREQSFKANNC